MLRLRINNSSISSFHRYLSVSSILSCEPPRQFNQDVPSFKPLNEQHKKKIEEDKKKLSWRTSIVNQPGSFRTNFRVFTSDEDSPSTVAALSQPIDLRPSAIKKWWGRYQTRKERYLQQFIPERHEILGNDLAAAHFIIYRKGKVKFVGDRDWMKMDSEEDEIVPLPNKYDPSYELEAIDCENMLLHYEGLENIRRLKKLRYLSFKNIKFFDDWCLDRISGSEFVKLEVLDVSGTAVTANGLQALYRIPSLKKLILDFPGNEDHQFNLTIAMLQDIMPNLEISSSEKI